MDQPNWTKEEDYQYTDSIKKADWAWEFTRRNPEYIAAYKTYLEEAQKLEEKYGKEWRKDHNAYGYIPEDALNKTGFHWKVGKSDKGFPIIPVRLDKHMGQRWHLTSMYDPQKDYRQGIKFIRPEKRFPLFTKKLDELHDYLTEQDLYSDGEQIGNIEAFDDTVAIVVFDLVHDISHQIKNAKEQLNKYAKTIKTDNTYLKPAVWKRHLRVLDAINAPLRPLNEKIAEVIGYPIKRVEGPDGGESLERIGGEYVRDARKEAHSVPSKILRSLFRSK